jgi:hypothetical protein
LVTVKNGPNYRFIAIREPLEQSELFESEEKQLPFPTLEMKSLGRYKIFSLVTNRTLPGEELIHWHRLWKKRRGSFHYENRFSRWTFAIWGFRFGLINLAGRVIERSRQLIVRLSANHPSTELLFEVRSRILQLAQVPSG